MKIMRKLDELGKQKKEILIPLICKELIQKCKYMQNDEFKEIQNLYIIKQKQYLKQLQKQISKEIIQRKRAIMIENNKQKEKSTQPKQMEQSAPNYQYEHPLNPNPNHNYPPHPIMMRTQYHPYNYQQNPSYPPNHPPPHPSYYQNHFYPPYMYSRQPYPYQTPPPLPYPTHPYYNQYYSGNPYEDEDYLYYLNYCQNQTYYQNKKINFTKHLEPELEIKIEKGEENKQNDQLTQIIKVESQNEDQNGVLQNTARNKEFTEIDAGSNIINSLNKEKIEYDDQGNEVVNQDTTLDKQALEKKQNENIVQKPINQEKQLSDQEQQKQISQIEPITNEQFNSINQDTKNIEQIQKSDMYDNEFNKNKIETEDEDEEQNNEDSQICVKLDDKDNNFNNNNTPDSSDYSDKDKQLEQSDNKNEGKQKKKKKDFKPYKNQRLQKLNEIAQMRNLIIAQETKNVSKNICLRLSKFATAEKTKFNSISKLREYLLKHKDLSDVYNMIDYLQYEFLIDIAHQTRNKMKIIYAKYRLKFINGLKDLDNFKQLKF